MYWSVLLVSIVEGTVISTSLLSCQRHCNDNYIAFPLLRGEFTWKENFFQDCDHVCRKNACEIGCRELEHSMSSCAIRCAENVKGVDSCLQGCHAVEQAFLAQLQELLDAVVAEVELNDTGLHVSLSFIESVATQLHEVSGTEVRWVVQSRSESPANEGWTWQEIADKPFRNTSLKADIVLQGKVSSPIFQVRLGIIWRERVAVSRTTDYAVPPRFLSPHLALSAQLQTAPNKYAICWKNTQPLARYRVSVATLDGNAISEAETVEECHQLRDLPRENCCRATVTEILPEGSTSKAGEFTVKIELVPDTSDVTIPSDPILVFANATHVQQLPSVNDYVLSKAPTIIPFDIVEGDKITAVCGVSSTAVVLGTERGGLFLVWVETNETTPHITPKTLREPDGAAITQITFDSMQRCVYAVLAQKGILRCALDPAPCTFYTGDLLNPVISIAIDSWNGFMYMINTNKDVQQGELFPFNATDVYTFASLRKLSDVSPGIAIEMDYNEQQLIVVLENGTIVRRDVITGETRPYRDWSFADVRLLRQADGRLFWLKRKCGEGEYDQVCFYSEDASKKAADEKRYSRYLWTGDIADLTFLTDARLPPLIMSPSQIGLATSATRARVTWTPPQSLPFQAPGALWRNVIYEVRLMASDGQQIADEKVDGTDLVVAISPGTEYTAAVRACTRSICSLFANAINTAFTAMPGTPIYLLRVGSDHLDVLDVLGMPAPPDSSLDSLLHKHPNTALVFDNSTRITYSSGTQDKNSPFPIQSGVVRQFPSGSSSLFISGLSVRHLALLSSRSILVIASSYHIVSYRLTGTFEQQIYSCSANATTCPEVVGLAADDSTGEVFYLVQFQNATVHLFGLNQENRTPVLMASSIDFPSIRQLVVANEKLMFVTKSNRMGFCDKKLGSLNLNFALSDVSFLVPITRPLTTNLFNFTGTVTMGEKNKHDLDWTIEPRLPPGSVLYKVLLYKDKLGVGEPKVLMSLSSPLTLPTSLLSTWASGQHFDASIEGINAWTSTSINKTGLIAPTKPPTMPLKLRIYATQQKTVDGARAIISIFWSPPLEWNGTPFQYVVNCTQDGAVVSSDNQPSTQLYHSFAVRSGKVKCAVAASNEPKNIGDYSQPVEIDSSELRPLVRLFAIDSTNSLISITNITADAARKKRDIPNRTRIEYEALAFIGNDLFAIRKEPDTSQIFLVQIDTNQIDNTVHKVSIGGDVTRIDAMTSDWVGHRLLFVSGKSLYQIGLDPFSNNKDSILTPKKLIDLSPGAADAKQLSYDPFTNTAYLLTRNGSLFSLNLWKGQEENLALSLVCLSSRTITWMTSEFAWNQASSPKIYALTWNGMITIDMAAKKCDQLTFDWTKFGEHGLKAISAFAIADKLFVFVTAAEMLIYGKDSIVPIVLANPPLRQIIAVSQSSQPFPERACFSLPSSSTIDFKIVNEGRTGALIEVTPPPKSTCVGISLPSTQYDIYFTRKGTDKVKHSTYFSEVIHVENGILDKETGYEVTVSWSNRYFSTVGVSSPRIFRTGFGYPSSPKDPFAIPITPDIVYLFWKLPETLNAPKNQIKYRISQQSLSSPSQVAIQPWTDGGFSPSTSDSASCMATPCRVKITNLRPSTDYKFWVTAMHESRLNSPFPGDSEAVSPEFTTKTKDVAGTLRPDNVTGSSLLLKWNSLQPEQPPTQVSVHYKQTGEPGEWRSPSNATFDGAVPSLSILLNGLLAATSYSFRFVAIYTGDYDVYGTNLHYKEVYFQGVQQARTKAGTPTAPQTVDAHADKEGWVISWTAPVSDGGSPITSYAVEVRVNQTAEWEIAERGLDGWNLLWRPAKTTAETRHWQFRVRAANQEGFGQYGYSSIANDEPVETSAWVMVVLTIIILLIVSILTLIVLMIRNRHDKKLKVDNKCITLEKMAQFPHSSQPLPSNLQNELKNLPHMGREDLEFQGRLGNGLFGEVFSAIAKKLPLSYEENTMVAVKVLKEPHTPEERNTFLREAILMNNFDHPNIVKLLGVCLEENCTPYLITELMEGGDLLRFLRNSRPTEMLPSLLSLKDLLSMTIDVGRGGAYLEQNRHVHRDLAARNCLISNKQNGTRITKIADFGLARPPDSYRTYSDTVFPARWFAPESIAEGVFTSHSDVWSFGVLLYEIFTLGNVPYDEIENDRVKEAIKGGCQLERPAYCPTQIFSVVQKCWAYRPGDRPSFTDLLPHLEGLRELSEYQDEKPYPTGSLSATNGFDASIESTDSERETRERFDKSGQGSIGSAKKGRPAIIRSLSKNKPKPLPLPPPDELDLTHPMFFAPSLPSPRSPPPRSPPPRSPLALSNDTMTTCDYGTPPSSSSSGYLYSRAPPSYSSATPKSRMSTAAVPIGHDNEAFLDDATLSHSWSGVTPAPPVYEVPKRSVTTNTRPQFPPTRHPPVISAASAAQNLQSRRKPHPHAMSGSGGALNRRSSQPKVSIV